jgi:hypothetical protein
MPDRPARRGRYGFQPVAPDDERWVARTAGFSSRGMQPQPGLAGCKCARCLRAETLADALCSWQVLTPRDPVVQGFIFNTPAIKLTLQILVAVDAELGRIGKIGAELDEKGPEVFIQRVKIVEVHIGAAVIDPRNGTPLTKSLAHRPGHTRLFLSHANEEHSFLIVLFESVQPCRITLSLRWPFLNRTRSIL